MKNLLALNWQKVFSLSIALLLSCHIHAQVSVLSLKADSLTTTKISLTNYRWLYHSGDNKEWSNPLFEDRDWHLVNTDFGTGKMIPGWKGTGWFRLWISADAALIQRLLALHIDHYGISDIFVDGVFKITLGSISKGNPQENDAAYTTDLVPFQLNDERPHLIAVHFTEPNPVFDDYAGFWSEIGYYHHLKVNMHQSNEYYHYILIVAGILLALAIFHLLLYAFYPSQRINLYYSMLLVILATIDWADYTSIEGVSGKIQQLAEIIFKEGKVLAVAGGWCLLYIGFNRSLPHWKTALLALCTGLLMIGCLNPSFHLGKNTFYCFFLVVFADELSLFYRAIRRDQQGVWLIGLGIVIITLFFFFVGIDALHLWTNRALVNLTMSAGFLALPICYSIYLALNFARTNTALSLKLAEVQQLSDKMVAQENENAELIRRQERLALNNSWLSVSTDLPSMEKTFLDKVRKAVLAQLDNENYSVELLSDDIGLSRAQLHRRLKSLTGLSPGDLLRAIRLQQAYKLLKNKSGTVAEVCYMVGFGNPQSFSASFSKHYGFPPSEAINH